MWRSRAGTLSPPARNSVFRPLPITCVVSKPRCASISNVMRHVSLLILAAFVANPQPPGQTTFSSSTQLVIRTVSVKDKSGNPIGGLTAKDFILTEDGKPQTISICEYEELQESATPVAPAAIAPV